MTFFGGTDLLCPQCFFCMAPLLFFKKGYRHITDTETEILSSLTKDSVFLTHEHFVIGPPWLLSDVGAPISLLCHPQSKPPLSPKGKH